jgi:hypothetical protein
MPNGTHRQRGLSPAWLICGLIAALCVSAGCRWNGEPSDSLWDFPDSNSLSRQDIQDQRARSLAAYQASLNRK